MTTPWKGREVMPKAGEFDVHVSDPLPCWVNVSYRGGEPMRFPHTEIADLCYALERARQEAIRKLPDRYKSEV